MADPNNAPEMESDIGLDENATGTHAASTRVYLAAADSLMTSAASALSQTIQANAAAHARIVAAGAGESETHGGNRLAQQAEAAKSLQDTGDDVHEVAAAAFSKGAAVDVEAIHAIVVDVVKALQAE